MMNELSSVMKWLSKYTTLPHVWSYSQFTIHCDCDMIHQTIENSNSAIIVMSQAFVDSIWCKEWSNEKSSDVTFCLPQAVST